MKTLHRERMPLRGVTSGLALAALLAACAASPRHDWTLTRLYFGLAGNGATISRERFEAFVAEEITPAFPKGFTLLDARGQWQDPARHVVREPTIVLELAHPESTEDDARLARIVERYCKRFGQKSVLRVDTAIDKIAF